MCLKTISFLYSRDGHLKPIRVCKFNWGSLHITMNIVITLHVAGLCYLTTGVNHTPEQLMSSKSSIFVSSNKIPTGILLP